MAKHSPSGFIVVLPDTIIDIPQDSYLSWLTLFYALPKELVKKRPEYLELPRNISQLLSSEEAIDLIETDNFLELIWDCYLLKIQQTQHQIDRLKKREEYLKNREKSTRTHRLCNLGGVVEHFIPEAKTMDRSSFFQLMERLIAIPEVADILKQYGGDDTSQSSTSM